jgi:hypothetical protein
VRALVAGQSTAGARAFIIRFALIGRVGLTLAKRADEIFSLEVFCSSDAMNREEFFRMTEEQIAMSCEGAIADRLEHYLNSEVLRFTPSCVVGRRYVGFSIGGQDFIIEINVKEDE